MKTDYDYTDILVTADKIMNVIDFINERSKELQLKNKKHLLTFDSS